MKKFQYKGYRTHIHYNKTDKLFYGKIEDIKDLVNFESKSIMDIEDQFHKAVDTYIVFCGEVGKDIKEKQRRKPKLGTKVYCIYQDMAIVTEVGYVGKDSFIVALFSDMYVFDIFEWMYEDYGKTWFTNANKVKAKLTEIAKANGYEDFTIVEDEDMLYIVEDGEE